MLLTRSLAKRILQFWYESASLSPSSPIPMSVQAKWYQVNPTLDEEIQKTYEPILLDLAHHLSTSSFSSSSSSGINSSDHDYLQDPSVGVSALILLDQFPRNMYRSQPNAFQFDVLALKLAKQWVKQIELIPLNQQGSVLLPFMHSEHLEDQSILLEYTKDWMQRCEPYPELLNLNVKPFHDFALKHYDLIKRFGRFPYRNVILKRTSTLEELEFLKSNTQNFGQAEKKS